MTATLIVPRRGPVRGIYAPATATVVQGLGAVQTRRASHVEPTEELSGTALGWLWSNKRDLFRASEPNEPAVLQDLLPRAWWADCCPVGGPVLGPYDSRDAALTAESEWLLANGIPTASEPVRTGQYTVQIQPPTSPILTQADLG